MYEAKLKTTEGKNEHIVLERVLNIEEATAVAKSLPGVEEVIAVYLSQYKEVYYDSTEDQTKWYEATLACETATAIDEKDSKGNVKSKITKHKILVEAKNFNDCFTRLKGILEQGYEMDQKAIKETNIAYVLQDVIADSIAVPQHKE